MDRSRRFCCVGDKSPLAAQRGPTRVSAGSLATLIAKLPPLLQPSQDVNAVVGAVKDGLSGVLVIRGEPGIGKTALLDDLSAGLTDVEVLRVDGIESEMSLGFAGLHQLLLPELDKIGALPAPQAQALRAAFGLESDATADRFLIGLAMLTLLANSAATRAMIVIVDDAQWLDIESEHIITFVARRLYADSIGVLIAARETTTSLALDALPSITLEGLEPEAARELLASVADGSLDDHVCARILRDARGNPLAIKEFTRDLLQRGPEGATLLPQPLQLERQLEARFVRQLRALPETTPRLSPLHRDRNPKAHRGSRPPALGAFG